MVNRNIVILLIVWLCIGCAPQTTTSTFTTSKYLNERWIDIDDLESISEGMNIDEVIDKLGEPKYFEIIDGHTLLTYNFATKLYTVPFGWKRFKMEKPSEKSREQGPPYGALVDLKIKFSNNKLIEIERVGEQQFLLAREKEKVTSETQKYNKPKLWYAIAPLLFLFLTTR